MPTPPAARPAHTLEMALCVFVLLAMLIAVFYAAWIGLSNYSRIGV